jgi:hypothetical protein
MSPVYVLSTACVRSTYSDIRGIYLYQCEKQSPGTAAAGRPTVSFPNAGKIDSTNISIAFTGELKILPQYIYTNNKAHMSYADIELGILQCTSQTLSSLLCHFLF